MTGVLRGAVLVALCGYISLARADEKLLRLKQTIPLADVEGRIDHFAFDPSGERLFVCALGNNTLEVVDLRKGERVRSIAGLGSPEGVGYVASLDRILVANDKGGICKLYDGKSIQQLAQIDLKDGADNVRYDDVRNKLYVGYGGGGVAVIDPADGKLIATVNLSAHPEAFVLEKNGNRIFANVPDSRVVAVIDREKRKVIATWTTDFAFANFPMALDEPDHRLFIGCRLPSKLVVLNTDSGAVVAKLNIAGDSDDVFYDGKRHRVYAICGTGTIDVIEQTDANTYKALSKIDTAPGARTGFFVPERDTLFVAVPHRGSERAEIRAYQIE